MLRGGRTVAARFGGGASMVTAGNCGCGPDWAKAEPDRRIAADASMTLRNRKTADDMDVPQQLM
jgi:hypothetical protein